MCVQPCRYVKNQCIVYFKEVNFMVPELHLIKNLNSLGSLASELVASHVALMMLGPRNTKGLL